jgi:hypothetical protein
VTAVRLSALGTGVQTGGLRVHPDSGIAASIERSRVGSAPARHGRLACLRHDWLFLARRGACFLQKPLIDLLLARPHDDDDRPNAPAQI